MLARPLAVDYDLNGRLLIYPLTRVVLRCTRGAHLCFDRQGKRKQLATAVKERGRGAKMEEGGYPPFWALSIRRTQRQLLCYVSSGELPPFMTITLCPPITDDVSIPQIKYSNACVMSSIIRHICLVLKLLKISFHRAKQYQLNFLAVFTVCLMLLQNAYKMLIKVYDAYSISI